MYFAFSFNIVIKTRVGMLRTINGSVRLFFPTPSLKISRLNNGFVYCSPFFLCHFFSNSSNLCSHSRCEWKKSKISKSLLLYAPHIFLFCFCFFLYLILFVSVSRAHVASPNRQRFPSETKISVECVYFKLFPPFCALHFISFSFTVYSFALGISFV